jgi:hypothetical protein
VWATKGRLLGPVVGPDGTAYSAWTNEPDEASIRELAAEQGVPPEHVEALLATLDD